jgi:hypothetical protein
MSQSPSGDCAYYGIGTSGFHQFQDIIDERIRLLALLVSGA